MLFIFRGSSRQSRTRGNGRRRGQGRGRGKEEEEEVADLRSDDFDRGLNDRQQSRGRGQQRSRQGRQLPVGGAEVGGCKTTGYETRIRDDCKNEFETECKIVQETKFRTEIDQQCRTKVHLSLKICYVTISFSSWTRNARKSPQRSQSKSVNRDMRKGM